MILSTSSTLAYFKGRHSYAKKYVTGGRISQIEGRIPERLAGTSVQQEGAGEGGQSCPFIESCRDQDL
jgi:hypothetical protein